MGEEKGREGEWVEKTAGLGDGEESVWGRLSIRL